MKIFSNFDTRLDWTTFLKKVEEYWNNNVLLIKRHPLFLYKAFLSAITSLFLFIWLVYLLYIQYSDNMLFFYGFLVLHLFWIWLWILLLFKKMILKLWNYKEFITCKEDLANIDISEFWHFLKYSIILFFYQFVISVINIVFIFLIHSQKSLSFWWSITIIIINLLFLFLTIKIIKIFIDFEMDFIIVTKDEIEAFNQKWFFKRKIISLDIQKIRSITTEKDGLFKSIFNIWSLKILSEWDTEHEWEIKFNYIHRLWKLKKAMLNLIHQNENTKGDLLEK